MEDSFIDLVVTSPPYDNLRDYNGYSFPFEDIAKQLYRVVKEGGVVVWVVGDATVDGSETGSSFRQALYFKECGFRLHDTMIYKKTRVVPLSHRRYEQCFEYMFILVKGRLETFNPIKVPCTYGGQQHWGEPTYHKTSSSGLVATEQKTIKSEKQKENIWTYLNARDKGFKHPAPFPEELARDHILSWSDPEGLVYDPFMGSGTTAKMSLLHNRRFIGSEISSEYCVMIEERLSALMQYDRNGNEEEETSETITTLASFLGIQNEI